MRRFKERLAEFLFPADSDQWLSVLRVGLGLQVILYTLSLWNDWNSLFVGTGHGLTSRDLGEAVLSVSSPLIPRLGWLVSLGQELGLNQSVILSITWTSQLAAGCFLVIGMFSRASAIIAWFLHLCATKSGTLFPYGMDNFMTIGLFYLMISPLPDRYSVDQRLRHLPSKNPCLLGFFRRILQLHLCLIYFFAGITKCLGGGWWDGSNMWRALTKPSFNIISPDVLVRLQPFLIVAGITVCLTEIGYPVFIWFRKTRLIWFSTILAMHLAIGVLMGMYLFASVMIILNTAAFGPGLLDFSRINNTPEAGTLLRGNGPLSFAGD
jgi:uncharacterized membrane protein YphA (DoxX/SURF4 family)